MARFSLALLLLFPAVALAQITATVRPTSYTVELSAPVACVWRVVPSDGVRLTPGVKMLMVAPAGVYRVEAEAKDGSGWFLRLTLGGAVVPPKPPVVPPVVVPVVGKFRAIVVYESATQTQAMAKVQRSEAILLYQKGKGNPPVRWVDASPETLATDCADALAAAKDRQLPVLVIEPSGGQRVLFACPDTEAAFLDVLKQFGGAQ